MPATSAGARFRLSGEQTHKRYSGDRQLAAPVQHRIQLARAQLINPRRVGDAPKLAPAPVAVEDQPDMAWRLVGQHLPQQPALVQRVERPGYRCAHAGPRAAQPQPPVGQRTRSDAQGGGGLDRLRHKTFSAAPASDGGANPIAAS